MKERICVLYGGSSDERAISIKSGTAILNALTSSGINAFGLDARNGFQEKLKKLKPDYAFIAIHGQGGEDGVIQKLLEKYQIPYVGSDPKSSRQAFNKITAKKIFDQCKIPTPSWRVVTKSNLDIVLRDAALPAVIKPACNGSSIGIQMVERTNQLKKALLKAILLYDKLIVEEKIVGREFTVGILGSRTLPVIELKPKRSFYDYTAKYTKGLTEYLVPAPINRKLSKRIQMVAKRAHQALGLRDYSRIDILMDRDENLFVLEANSIPGFTETSLLPKAARAVGIDFSALCLKLLGLARRRME